MLALIINLWIMVFIFGGSIIACLDDIKKELQKSNSNLEKIDDRLYALNKELTHSVGENVARLRDSLSSLTNNFVNFFKMLTKRSR